MTHAWKGYPKTMGCVDNILQQTRTPQLEALMVAIDVSGSMKEKDWQPTRLSGARDAFGALLERKQKERPDDWVGLVTFAANARVKSNPVKVGTHISILLHIAQQMCAFGGTNITAALEVASAAFNGHNPRHHYGPSDGPFSWLWSLFFAESKITGPQFPQSTVRRILLLTDGEHTTGRSPVAVAQRLKADGVEINCIGIGGTPGDVDEAQLKSIASCDPQGNPLYWFIGDRAKLIKKFESLATGLRSINT